MEITERMRAILDFVKKKEIVADIGCDHGIVSAAMIREGRAERVIACDVSAKSLQKTEALVRKYRLERIDTVVSNGLCELCGEKLDCVIVAGMGGLLIRDILAHGLEEVRGEKELVLAPQGDEYELRVFLYETGYHICNEMVVKDKKYYYQIIYARQGKAEPPEDVFMHFGYYPVLRKEKLQKDFLQHRLREYEMIAERAKSGRDTEAYVVEKKKMCERISEVLKCL